MSGISKATLVGRITRDPETKTINDSTLASFGIAVNRKVKGEEEANFYDIDAWNRLAEVIAANAKKGDMVYVEANMRVDRFEDKQGQSRSKIKLTANQFQFLPGGRKDSAPTTVMPDKTDQPF